jgi:hypothetical protein
VGETKDLAAANPAKVKTLTTLWQAWNAGNIPPRWDDTRWNGEEARKQRKKAKKAGKA